MAIEARERLEVYLDERNSLRSEIVEIEKLIVAAGAAFWVGAGTFLTVYFGDLAGGPLANKGWVLFALSQFEVYCGVLMIAMLTNIAVHNGYVAAIEDAIKRLNGGTSVIAWESEVAKRFYGSSRAAFFWCAAFLVLLSVAILSILAVLATQKTGAPWTGYLAVAEAIFAIAAIAVGMKQANCVRRESTENHWIADA